MRVDQDKTVLLTVSFIIFMMKILRKNKERHVKTNGKGDFSDGIVDALEANVLESNCSKRETAHKVPNLHICRNIFL